MYVRWKKRKGKRGDSYYVVLVESKRISKNPRQKFIDYLGSIYIPKRENLFLSKYFLKKEGIQRRKKFWISVISKLENLKISDNTKDYILYSLNEAVPVLTVPEIEDLRSYYDEWDIAISGYYGKGIGEKSVKGIKEIVKAKEEGTEFSKYCPVFLRIWVLGQNRSSEHSILKDL